MAEPPEIDTSFERALKALLRRQRGPAEGCPDSALISAYYARTLDEDERTGLEPHLAVCVDCQAELALLARLDAEAPAAAATPPVQVPEPPPVPETVPEPTPEPEPAPEPEPVVVKREPILLASEDEAPPPEEKVEEKLEAVEAEAEEVLEEEFEEAPAAFEPAKLPPFLPAPRRSRWRWIGPTALAASAVLAVSLTYRFAEQASRRSLEPRWDVLPTARIPGPPPRVLEEPPPPQALQQKPAAPPPADAKKAGALGAKEDRYAQSAPQPAPPAAATEAPRQARELARAKSAPAIEGGEALADSQRRRQMMADESERDAAAVGSAQMRTEGAAAGAAPATAPAAPAVSRGAFTVISRNQASVRWRFSGTTIERSEDAGKSWRPQTSAPAEILAASASSAQSCWAVGRGGTVMRTADGERWERVSPPTTADVVHVSAWSASSATVKSADGSRFSTSDGGTSWSKL